MQTAEMRKKKCDLFSIFAENAECGKSARIKIELSSTTNSKTL